VPGSVKNCELFSVSSEGCAAYFDSFAFSFLLFSNIHAIGYPPGVTALFLGLLFILGDCALVNATHKNHDLATDGRLAGIDVAYENQTAGMFVGVNFDDIFLVNLYDDVLDDLSFLDFFGLGDLFWVLWLDYLFYSLLNLLLGFFLFVASDAEDCILSFFLIICVFFISVVVRVIIIFTILIEAGGLILVLVHHPLLGKSLVVVITLGIKPVKDLDWVRGILGIVGVYENNLFLSRIAGKPKHRLHVKEHGGFAFGWERFCLCLLLRLNLLRRHLLLFGLLHEANVWELFMSTDSTRLCEHELFRISFKGITLSKNRASRICARVKTSLLLLLVLITATHGWEILLLCVKHGALAKGSLL